MPERILIIEDDVKLAIATQQFLILNSYEVVAIHEGIPGLQLAMEEPWELILMDLSLPDTTGLDILNSIRNQGSKVPVIIITVNNLTESIVQSFEIGANDYIVKPFNEDELLVRIRNLLNIFRHIHEHDPTLYPIIVGDLQIDLESRQVIREEEQIELTPKEFELLVYLAKQTNRVCSRESILNEVWGYDFMADTNVIDVFIRYLRKKIDKGRRFKMIQTVRGVGYMLRDEASELNPEEEE